MWLDIGLMLSTSPAVLIGAYACRRPIKRVIAAGPRLTRNRRGDMMKDRALQRHRQQRRQWALEREDDWLREWVHLIGSKAELDYMAKHYLRYPNSYPGYDEAALRRQAERQRIRELTDAIRERQALEARTRMEKARDAAAKKFQQVHGGYVEWREDFKR